MLCQWARIHANRSCRNRIGRAASAAWGRGMEGKEVVIALQRVLGNALWWQGAMGRQPLPLVGLLEPGEHWLVAGHSAADIQRLDQRPPAHSASLRKQPSGGGAITAIAQLLPQLPPALIGEQLPLVKAVQQRPGFAPERIDQMLQINAQRPTMALDAAVAASNTPPCAPRSCWCAAP